MQRSGDVAATERARWLAELAAAIEEAQKVAWRLGVTEGTHPEALDLYSRLESARTEIAALRRGTWTGDHQEFDPFWLQLLPWRPQLAESPD